MDGTRERALISLLLVALTFAVYAQVRAHEFVHFDDVHYIVDNPDLAAGLTGAAVARVFTRPHNGDFIPLTYVSLQLDRTLFGTWAGGTLLVNAALHAASAVLLFLALAQMTGATWRSAFVAAVFAAHPLHVESVAWAFERKDVLSGLFWMLSLWLYARRVARPGGAGRFAPVAVCMVAGMLAKPMLVTLPVTLLLLDYWPLGRLTDGRRLRAALVEKWPLFAIVAGFAVLTLARHEATGTVPAWGQIPLGVRLLYVPLSYAFYLEKSIWPAALAMYYPYPHLLHASAPPAGAAALAALALVALTALALRSAKRAPYLLSGWLWYLITLLPVIGIVQVGLHVYADRYGYIPQIGVAWLIAWGAVDLLPDSRAAARVLGAAAAAAVLALAVGAWLQVHHWRNTVALFEHTLAVNGDDDYLSHWRLARAYAEEGRDRDAIAQLRETVKIQPDVAIAQVELARILDRAGESDGALPHYERALALDPALPGLDADYGVLLVTRGRLAEAQPLLERALVADTGQPRAHAALAQIYTEAGRARDAALHYREALRLEPDYLPTVNNFAMLLASSDDAAVRNPEEAIRLVEPFTRDAAPEPAVLDTLALAHAAAGHREQAIRIAERATALAAQRGDDALRQSIERNLERYRKGAR